MLPDVRKVERAEMRSVLVEREALDILVGEGVGVLHHPAEVRRARGCPYYTRVMHMRRFVRLMQLVARPHGRADGSSMHMEDSVQDLGRFF